MHLDEERLQRFLDDQLDPTARAAAREHLNSCADCRRLHETLERNQLDARRLLNSLDHPASAVPLHIEEIIARAEVRERALATPAPRPVRWARLAAGIGLAILLVGAAYAAPGSPLPGWIDGLVRSVAPPVEPPVPPTRPAPPAEDPVVGTAGIAVTPGNGLVIEFPKSAVGSTVWIRLTDGAQVLVRAPQGAATFTAGAGRIVIGNALTPARFEIEIPRSALRVELSIVNRPVFRKEGPTVITSGPASPDSTWLIPLGP